ncbi:dihydroxy-acid dehydratase [Emiliania huxleyi CCMP1516]|uniref:Dihydroxy-acid/6-phosphogluconate dehydratase N-terminal domain-containing protein n=2 Tax=Emiliania huxleyi TaxID=2903 RepID=A0A0D3KD86_EMIH1|nr:dihydroxy-acid dehydratase [Emiliania huxleyi CCMP1516]EOD33721.1 dihydroxy-acid dehydratase [Emiliania huxleyi CCMP1516]|eukprot:XP_005786150.1 dihydroxy-acid dehydratase [Emiliania huxleyi CCMP1516]
MEDLHHVGGTPGVLKYMFEQGFHLHGDCMTVTGKTMAENLADLPATASSKARRSSGPSRSPSSQRATSLSGNLAPPGFAVGKITSKEGTIFRGPARCFDQWEIRRKSSSERLTPHERAIAIRWIVAFVEPPVTMTSRTEFSKALAVMMSRGMSPPSRR